MQTGLLFVHGWSRVQWEAGLKFGLMANIYHQHGTDTASNPPGIPPLHPSDISNNGSDLSALFEVSFAACYRLTDNLGLRLGTRSTTSPGWPWPRGSLAVSAMAAMWPSTDSRSACGQPGEQNRIYSVGNGSKSVLQRTCKTRKAW